MNARCHWCRHTLNVNQQHAQRRGARRGAAVPADARRGGREDPRVRLQAPALRAPALQEGVRPRERPRRLPALPRDRRPAPRRRTPARARCRRGAGPRSSGDNTTTYYAADVYRVDRHGRLHGRRPHGRGRRGPGANFDGLDHQQHRQHGPAVRHQERREVELQLPRRVHQREARPRRRATSQPVLEDQLLSIGRSQVEGSLAQFDRGVRWEAEKVDVGGSRWVSMYLPVWLYSYYQENTEDAALHRGQRPHGRDDGQRPGLAVAAARRGPHRRHVPRGHRRLRSWWRPHDRRRSPTSS